MSDHTNQILRQYSDDDLNSFLMDGLCPAHCKACGEYVQDSEPDLRSTSFDCPECGEHGKIESVLSLAGYM